MNLHRLLGEEVEDVPQSRKLSTSKAWKKRRSTAHKTQTGWRTLVHPLRSQVHQSGAVAGDIVCVPGC